MVPFALCLLHLSLLYHISLTIPRSLRKIHRVGSTDQNTNRQTSMPKRATITIEDTPSPRAIKDDPDAQDQSSTPPPTTPKRAKKSSSAPSTTGSSTKKSPAPRNIPESAARTAKGRFMEMLIESGLKSINKKDVQEEVSRLPVCVISG
jgi:hypothetical protein